MRRWLTARAAGDPRIAFRDRVPQDELRGLMRDHHVVVSPSRWESWSNVVRKALAGNRPVLATPVGGVVDAIEPGRTGWLTDDASAAALRAGIERLRERREEIARLIADGAPRAGLEARLDHEGLVSAYVELGPGATRRPCARRIGRSRPSSPRAARGAARAVARRAAPEPCASSGHAGQRRRAAAAAARPGPWRRRAGAVAPAGLPCRAARRAQERARPAPRRRDELDAAFLPRALAALAADPALPTFRAAGRPSSVASAPNAAAATIGEGIGNDAMLVRRADLEAVGIPDRQHGDPLTATAVALAALDRWGTVVPEPLVRTSAQRAQPPVGGRLSRPGDAPGTVRCPSPSSRRRRSGALRQAPGDAAPRQSAPGTRHALARSPRRSGVAARRDCRARPRSGRRFERPLPFRSPAVPPRGPARPPPGAAPLLRAGGPPPRGGCA